MNVKWLVIGILCVIGGLSIIPSVMESRENKRILIGMSAYSTLTGVAILSNIGGF